MYSVGLSNDSCMFDYADGFETPAEALDWADGRGGIYLAYITNDDSIYTDRPLEAKIQIDCRKKGEKRFLMDLDWGRWIPITGEKLAKYI